MRYGYAGLWLLLLTAGTVQAHVIWVLPADKGDAVRVVWSDDPKPDNKEEPLTTIDKAEVLLRHAEGRVETLKWTQDKDEYRVACPGTGFRTLAVIWNDDKAFKKGATLMTYVAKTYLPDPSGKVAVPEKGSSWEQVGLEFVPRPDRGPNVYQLVYKGRPVAETRVRVDAPSEETLPVLRSDKEGLFTFMPPKPGLYGLTARHTAAEAVEYKGKKYTHRWYWSSLVIQVPAAQDKKGP